MKLFLVLNYCHSSGLVKKKAPDSFIIALTKNQDEKDLLSGILDGVYEYLNKPFKVQDLLFILKRITLRELHLSNLQDEELFTGMVAKSRVMLEVFDTIKRVANFSTTVLIQGESGTGKELLARAIHLNSVRKKAPFVAINCGAIPENLIESELFGYKKGAFTDAVRDKPGLFDEANGGTIFLDEIGEMPPQLQVKLLRVIQERQIQPVGDEKSHPIDVRIIAATLRDLETDVKTNRFREDLFYRLNVVSIAIPPLRERPEDIEVLAQYFIKKHNKKLGLNIKRISLEALEALQAYQWKGNVRELENCIEHAVVMSESGIIDLDSLPDAIKKQNVLNNTLATVFGGENLSIKQCTEALERHLIVAALKKTNGNRTHAAKILEISHRSLLYKLKEYGLDRVCK